MKRKAFQFLIVVAVLMITPFVYSSEKLTNIFLEANQAYNKNDYNKAIFLYKKLLDSGVKNGFLYYNLGNCFFRKGEMGEAILNYKKAQTYIPRDEDLKANLDFARQNIKDKVEVKGAGIRERIFFLYYSLNLKEIFILFLILNGIFWSSAILYLFKPLSYLKTIVFVFLFLMSASGVSTATKFYALENLKDGVILTDEVSVKVGNDVNDTVLFTLHEGTEVEILDETNGWLKIRMPQGSAEMRGWIEKKFVAII